jgi:predicted nucleic acid-binding protein
MEDWVLVDTLIWASFFSKPNSREKRAIDELIDADRVVLVGPIVAEVLLGFRRKAQADWVASRLQAAHFVEATWDDWKSAAEIGRELASKRHELARHDPAHVLVIPEERVDRVHRAVLTLPTLDRPGPSTTKWSSSQRSRPAITK